MTISVIGIGYGGDVTSEARTSLQEADVVIGHEDFIASVRHLVRDGAECFDVQTLTDTTDNVFAARARSALDRAQAGAQVVIVSGGDPGLLGMAGPLISELSAIADARSLPRVRVLPGLSAWQYASARLGAPFNGGICVISLCLYSHTEEKIRRQVEGVAAAGLGVVAYMLRHNGEAKPERYPTDVPAADLARRRFLLLRDALLRHRPADTPTYLFSGFGDDRGDKPEQAPLQDSLHLWERSDDESVFCVPGVDHASAHGYIWDVT
ncbi:SAM-dependent methyltransferase [Micromonospora sp. NPDC049101]|uniref:SAM-dependent methyltransferase n=1 Tax=Micromonospora sp. NPDC049101 TaxID=3155032 RepID=UPI0033F0D8C6